ncbi:MAG: ABC transporter permease [Actinomycetota bacterium]
MIGSVAAGGGSLEQRKARGAHATRKRLTPYALLGPGGIYLALFFVAPLIVMVFTSLQQGGLLAGGFTFDIKNPNWASYSEVAANGRFYLRSVVYAAIVTVIGLLLAYPMTYWIAFYGGRRKTAFLLLLLLPFFVSFVIRTIQWNFILGDNGLIFGPLKNAGLLPQDFRVLATPVAVIAGITYNFLPFTALPLFVALDRIDKRLVEAAKDLYATRWDAFRKVVLPLSIPGVFAAVILTFVPATGDYVNASVLGGLNTTMIGNIIQTKFLRSQAYPEAAALSIVLMFGMLVLVSIYAKLLGTEDEALAAGA